MISTMQQEKEKKWEKIRHQSTGNGKDEYRTDQTILITSPLTQDKIACRLRVMIYIACIGLKRVMSEGFGDESVLQKIVLDPHSRLKV